MSSKDLPNIGKYADLHLQPVRKLHVTVEVLDKELKTVETIEGLSTGGSINISNSSLIRRTGSLSFVLFDNLLPRQKSLLWMNNQIRVYAGIENLSSREGTITHFCLGTYHITEPSIDIDPISRAITINLEDRMTKWEQEELETKMIIEADTPLHTAVSALVNHYGEWNTNIEFTNLTVPYKLEFSEGDNVLSILTKLRDLYMDWECYYDTDGTFIFKKMNIQRRDGEPIAWYFNNESNLVTKFNETFTYKEVRNRVLVIGQMDTKTGVTPKAEVYINNEESPFHETEIGIKKRVIVDSTYSTSDQCNARAKFELFRQSTFQEKMNISTLPIYFLDGNDIIELLNLATNEVETCVVDSISIGLGVTDEMSITAHKLYYETFDISSVLEEARYTADIVIDGIMNKGWLSLSEKRVADYYGLVGTGSKLRVQFERGGRYNTTAYVTAYLGQKNQIMTIDLDDFNSTGDSGDTGSGKADYSDRILGHEVVHAIMNDVFSIEKTKDIPEWFKEGVSEFLHGADERLKTSIVVNGTINEVKLNELITTAEDMLYTNSWAGVSDSYSAGYLITKFLDKRISTGKDMKNLMNSINLSTKAGNLALQDAIVENTDFVSYLDFVVFFKNNANNFVKTNVTLNLTGDEVDTGSIGGIDHRGTQQLNADAIFNNALAVKDVAMQGLAVEIIRP